MGYIFGAHEKAKKEKTKRTQRNSKAKYCK
jgi:hypothetical protein